MDKNKYKILMVEDETEILNVNARMLKRRGYEVLTASTVAQAYNKLSETTPDLLMLDIMLPDGYGTDICKKFRESSDKPVVFLTGKADIKAKVEGLNIGGDYYLTKPYNFSELLAVIERLLAREQINEDKQERLIILKIGKLTVDIQNSRAFLDGANIALTAKEFAMLLLLIRNEDNELSPSEIYESVWGTSAENDIRTVRTHMVNLRKKIEADDSPDYDVVATYGKGYKFTRIR